MTDAPTPGADDGWALDWPTTGLAIGPEAGGRLRRRPALAADDDLLRRWFVEARPDLDGVPLPPEGRRRLLDQQLAARAEHHRTAFPGAEHWVLELDGEPVGHLVVHRDAARVHLVELELTTARRGCGLGTAALTAVLAAARRHRLPTRLTVSTTNPARRLYERLGFRPSAEVDPAGNLTMEAPAVDLAALTADDFEPLIGQRFTRPLDDADPVDLRLDAVDRGRPRPGGRPPFSLLFVGPAEPRLLDDVHPIVHPALGRLELFIGAVLASPPRPDATTYEVVFG